MDIMKMARQIEDENYCSEAIKFLRCLKEEYASEVDKLKEEAETLRFEMGKIWAMGRVEKNGKLQKVIELKNDGEVKERLFTIAKEIRGYAAPLKLIDDAIEYYSNRGF